MYLTDYHIHSKYSFDCETELEDICEMAVKHGLKEIAITDHMDIFSTKPYGYILDCAGCYEALWRLKESYKGRLKVIVGVELGQPQANPSQAAQFLEDYPLDFIIGSVHNMENDIDAYDLDYKKEDYHQVMQNYIEWLIAMALQFDFDVMGHITYPSRYVYEQIQERVDFREYYDDYRRLFKILIESGRGIELNMSGMARGINETMPTMDLLKMYHEMGGEIVTVGSDAHIAEHVGKVSLMGYEMLQEAGFTYVSTFEGRKLKNVRIAENG